jgi:hypothetical protein
MYTSHLISEGKNRKSGWTITVNSQPFVSNTMNKSKMLPADEKNR